MTATGGSTIIPPDVRSESYMVKTSSSIKGACDTKLRPILTESLPDRLVFKLPEKFDSMVNLLEAITFFSDSFPKHMAAVVRKYYDIVDYNITYRSKWTAQSKL